MNRKTCWGALLACALIAALGVSARAQNDEELAHRQFDSGMLFMQGGHYAEGLRDFQAVVDSFPKSSVADDALLQIATYQLAIARDLKAAQAANDRLLKDYPDSDSAPMGYVLDGRLRIAKGRTPADVDAALSSFERVPRLFPGSEAVAAAGYFTGDTLQLVRRWDDASKELRRVMLQFPQSIWAARAVLDLTASLAQSDKPSAAFADLQRIRRSFPGTPEAEVALDYNTLLYRLYVRPPAQRFEFKGTYVGAVDAKFKDVIGVAVDSTGRILLGHQKGVTIFDAHGKVVTTMTAEDPTAFFVAEADRVVIVRKEGISTDGAAPVSLGIPASIGHNSRVLDDVHAAVVLSSGDRLIADHDSKTVLRMTAAGQIGNVFAPVNATHLAVNRLDDVAMIDHDSKAVVIVDRDGKPLSTIAAKGASYEFDDPADVEFDALGDLYVLDAGKPTIYVFSPKNQLLATVTPPVKDLVVLQKPRAFALDPAGRLYVFDDRAQRIQVLQ